MGAWDCGPFDNDDALDFLDDLVDVEDDPGAVADMLREVFTLGASDVDATDASRATAAAAWVAAALPGAAVEGFALPADLGSPEPTAVLGAQAVDFAALAAAGLTAAWGSTSELRELWEEAGEEELERVDGYAQKLRAFLERAAA